MYTFNKITVRTDCSKPFCDVLAVDDAVVAGVGADPLDSDETLRLMMYSGSYSCLDSSSLRTS